MNWLDFWLLGPASLWFLGIAIIFLSLVMLKHTKMVITEMRSGTNVTQELKAEIAKVNTSLLKDTARLTEATSALNGELSLTRQVITDLKNTLNKIYSWNPWEWYYGQKETK